MDYKPQNVILAFYNRRNELFANTRHSIGPNSHYTIQIGNPGI